MPDSCPIWDLNDLYTGLGDVKLATDVAYCRKTALSLSDGWFGRLSEASAVDLASVITQYEHLLERLGLLLGGLLLRRRRLRRGRRRRGRGRGRGRLGLGFRLRLRFRLGLLGGRLLGGGGLALGSHRVCG